MLYINDLWVDIDCGDLCKNGVELLSKDHRKETGSGA